MTRMIRTPKGRLVGWILFVFVFNGCHGWHARPGMSIPQVVAEGPERVRVTRVGDPYQIVLVDPQMRGDTLIGMAGDWRARVGMPIPVDEVRTIETQRLKPYATAATAVVATVTILGVAFLVAFLSLDCFIDCM